MDYLHRAKRFRDQAEECRRLAELARSHHARDAYLAVAKSSIKLAEDMEFLGHPAWPAAE